MKKLLIAIVLLLLVFVYAHVSESDQLFPRKDKQTDTGSTPKTSNPSVAPTVGTAYKDGSYSGITANAFYGPLQIKAIISEGKIADVVFLQYPNDRDDSVRINTYAMPLLKQEAITLQNAHVDIVSGATQTSQAFVQSLQSALNQAK